MHIRMRIRTALTLTIVALLLTRVSTRAADTLPSQLSDDAYWKMITSLSEPDGYYQYTVITSNETAYQEVLPQLTKSIAPGGTYLGVGPEQNFTYIAALKPKIAFIIDIRRENMLLHLMYKALVEISVDRVDFLSRLFARQRPVGVGHDSTAQALFEAFRPVSTSADLAEATLRTVFDRLERVHRFTLSREDEISIKDAYEAFCRGGPDIRWDSSGDSWIPSYVDLMAETDRQGRSHAYLASEENFRVLKEYETSNRIVPLVGDFSGDKTLRAVGRYLKNHHETVTAFYTSNVEGYLFQSDRWLKFAMNVSTLPIDAHSTFIRTHFSATRFTGGRPEYRTFTVVDPIRELVQAFTRG